MQFFQEFYVRLTAFQELLFFSESDNVKRALDQQVWLRTRTYMYTTAALVALWGLFDALIDFKNLWLFLALRGIYTPIALAGALLFFMPVFRNHHEQWAKVHYVLLILDIGIMVLWTDSFIKYLIGFSTVFCGASVIMLWRFWNTLIPGLLVIAVAWVRFTFFPHNVPTEELVAGLYYFSTCLIFSSIISAYGYWSTYKLTESKIRLQETQDKLIQAEKLSSLNMIVASVAHEINTPIGTALTATTHANEQLDKVKENLKLGEVTLDQLAVPSNSAKRCLGSAITELLRITELVQRFKQTAVDHSSDKQRRFDLLDYIKNNIVNSSLYPILKHEQVVVDIKGNDNVIVESYPGDFSQILMNLVLNSIAHGFTERMDYQGHITIQLQQMGEQATLVYRDNGLGMDNATQQKIFDPFFTTKGTELSSQSRGHQGSGLGLSIVYNIVTQKLGGIIEVSSSLGLGTTFTITFPLILKPTKVIP